MNTKHHPTSVHPRTMPAYFLGRPVQVYLQRFAPPRARRELPRAA